MTFEQCIFCVLATVFTAKDKKKNRIVQFNGKNVELCCESECD